jgi:hypothetical protein
MIWKRRDQKAEQMPLILFRPEEYNVWIRNLAYLCSRRADDEGGDGGAARAQPERPRGAGADQSRQAAPPLVLLRADTRRWCGAGARADTAGLHATDGDGVLALDGEDLREEMACWPAQRRRGVKRRRGEGDKAARRGPRRRLGERTEVFRWNCLGRFSQNCRRAGYFGTEGVLFFFCLSSKTHQEVTKVVPVTPFFSRKCLCVSFHCIGEVNVTSFQGGRLQVIKDMEWKILEYVWWEIRQYKLFLCTSVVRG